MLAINGIYDGKTIYPIEKLPNTNKKYKVIITFVEEMDGNEETRNFSSQSNAFSFWEDKREDLYQDYLKKIKK